MPIEVDPGQRKREVVEAAHALIREGGLGAVTVRNLAARLGCSTTAITHYFADKSEIVLASYQHSVARAKERRARAASMGLAGQLEAVLPIGQENWDDWLIYIAFWPVALHDPLLKTEQRERNRQLTAFVEGELVRGNQLPASISDEERREIAGRIVATIYGVAIQAIFDPEDWPAERQREVLRVSLACWLPELAL
ncbi:MAG TPA: TetR/AcrR family transcriptional regulator [Croceicoccus sp.]|nr:TetR/AcrR family transcriptional regulator [Croceicoccus sp.]